MNAGTDGILAHPRFEKDTEACPLDAQRFPEPFFQDTINQRYNCKPEVIRTL